MIRIFTGWSNPGGSTTALANLCNAFNEFGYECKLYGPHLWASSITEHFIPINQASYMRIDDRQIGHFIDLPGHDFDVYSCHETNVFFPSSPFFRRVQYVSEFQRDWHLEQDPSRNGVVIPNIISDINIVKTPAKEKIGGIIGSIDPHKRVHLSIDRALKDCDYVYIYGAITDQNYFDEFVAPRLSDQVFYRGFEKRENIYGEVNRVYHSSKRETFNYIKAECDQLGIPYYGLAENDPNAEYWTKEEIINAWKELLSL